MYERGYVRFWDLTEQSEGYERGMSNGVALTKLWHFFQGVDNEGVAKSAM
jgi:hypothetical protein